MGHSEQKMKGLKQELKGKLTLVSGEIEQIPLKLEGSKEMIIQTCSKNENSSLVERDRDYWNSSYYISV